MTQFHSIGATTLLAPIPAVLLSCREKETGKENLITVAWTGVINTDPPMISVSIKPERMSHDIIQNSGVFCLNLVDRALCRAADLCGVKSGREIDKFRETGLHALNPEDFDAPALEEAPAFLCCRVKQMIPLGSHDLFLCQVERVMVRDDLMDEKGGLHMERAGLVSYVHGEYFPLEKSPEGFFGYSVARKEILRRRLGKTAEKKESGEKRWKR